MTTDPQTPPAPAPRSKLVTILAWIVIALSALMLPISAITAIMVAVGSYGTANTDVLGYFTIVVAPPLTLAAGVCMLLRQAWSRYYIIAALVLVVGVNARDMMREPTPQTTTISPTGVRTTVLASVPTYSVPAMVAALAAIALLLTRRVREEFGAARARTPG